MLALTHVAVTPKSYIGYNQISSLTLKHARDTSTFFSLFFPLFFALRTRARVFPPWQTRCGRVADACGKEPATAQMVETEPESHVPGHQHRDQRLVVIPGQRVVPKDV